MKKVLRWGAIGFAVLIVIVILVPSEKKSDTSPPAPPPPPTADVAAEPAAPVTKPPPPPPPAAPVSCGKTATDECTPHVNLGGSVRVDALIWKVTSVRVADSLGDQTYGLGAKADGRFVIVTLRVHSDKNESATFSSDVAKLEVGGNTYSTDNDGTVAAIGAGEQPFFLEDIGPDSDVTGKVVFDVPPKVLARKVEIRFNELGFGSTHAYIRLPAASLGA